MTEERLEEINRKLQIIVENSFLSRLDLLFSVLLSLTIFFVGLTFTDASLQTGGFSAFWVGLLTILTYTLVGEFWAIIKDDVVRRFKFWIALIFDFATLGFVLLMFLVYTYLNPWHTFFVYMVWYFFFALPFVRYAGDLFSEYVKRFPSRFKDFPSKAWASVMFPSLIGQFLFVSVVLAYHLLFTYA